jgi:hypothetical protein
MKLGVSVIQIEGSLLKFRFNLQLRHRIDRKGTRRTDSRHRTHRM